MNKSLVELALQESIDKDSPKKVQFIDTQRKMFRKKYGKQARYDGACPNCKRHVYPGYKYCPECGQKLDWEE